jgi:platelet-activating factor acetylhydrolase IB subunit alpha
MALSPKQRFELNQAIAGYLITNGFSSAHFEFLKQLGADESLANTSTDMNGLLERKWTAVVRLQKRVTELETQLKQLEANDKDSSFIPGSVRRTQNGQQQLPKAPHRHELAGHRSPITRITFHPV